MALTLNDPITPNDITQQGVTTMILRFPHTRNAGDTAMELDKPNIALLYEVTTWGEDGTAYKTTQIREIAQPDWPTNVRIDVRDLYSKVELHAVSEGLIGEGTPEVIS